MHNNTKRKCVVLDTDDVLLDYTPMFGKFVQKHYNIQPQSVLPTSEGYAEWLQCSDRDIDNFVEHFNESAWEFGTLPPIQNSVQCLKDLHSTGAALVVVSKCGRNGHAIPLRKANLYNVFGDVFSDIHILQYCESKTETFRKLSEVYNVRAVLDDNTQNIDDALKLKLPSFLFIREQNADSAHKYNSFRDWNEMKNEVMKNLISY